MVPSALRERLRQGRVLVRNWHVLNWESAEQLARKRGVDKRGAKSDAAYAKEVLGDMASASNILVINDEAHHAWRVPAESKLRGVAKADIEEATRWIGGLDRIHRSRGLLGCYDFSATPFAPSGKESSEEALFRWVVSRLRTQPMRSSGHVGGERGRRASTVRQDVTAWAKHIYLGCRDRLRVRWGRAQVPSRLPREAERPVPCSFWRSRARTATRRQNRGQPDETAARDDWTRAVTAHVRDRRAVRTPSDVVDLVRCGGERQEGRWWERIRLTR